VRYVFALILNINNERKTITATSDINNMEYLTQDK